MRISDIEGIDRDYLTPVEVSNVLDIAPQYFRRQVRKDKKEHTDSFGFPTIVSGQKIKIPKIPFIKFMRGESA